MILANPEEDEEKYNSYLNWLSNGFETHLFCVRDEELCMDDYLRQNSAADNGHRRRIRSFRFRLTYENDKIFVSHLNKPFLTYKSFPLNIEREYIVAQYMIL